MKHTDRITKTDHIFGFLAGASVSVLMTLPVLAFACRATPEVRQSFHRLNSINLQLGA